HSPTGRPLPLAQTDYAETLSLWTHGRQWSELRLAYEMIPFLPKAPDGKTATTIKTAEGAALTVNGATTSRVRIDRGGFGVDIQFDSPQTVKLGQNNTVLIELVKLAPKPTPAEKVGLKAKLGPA